MPEVVQGQGTQCWFVGSAWDDGDQTARFLADGVWENGYEDRLLDVVRSMRVGDRIAIKAAYVRKHGLQFDNRNHVVSVMAIKAVGTVTANPGDGRRVQVRWKKVDPPREWYFYTGRTTVWRILPGNWMNDNLIAFAFDGATQAIDRFRNEPYWRERFGDQGPEKHRFAWTRFYEAVAEKLLGFRQDRGRLLGGIREMAGRTDLLSYLHDGFADGTTGPLRDICPFTVLGIFNRGIKEENRKALAADLARFLGVDEPVPVSFEGIPVLNNQRSCFFSFERERKPRDIDDLWDVFVAADQFAKSDDQGARAAFQAAYDRAVKVRGVAWVLTTGLYWAHPWVFPTLDSVSRNYIKTKLNLPIRTTGPQGRCNAEGYLGLMDAFEPLFKTPAYPVHSYPELSLEAWRNKDPGTEPPGDSESAGGGEPAESVGDASGVRDVLLDPYSVADVLDDGCFLDRAALERILATWRDKMNLILQGPPGTGKTWLAKRLAFALMGQKDERRVRTVQFHTNLSYEDFVRGWRPSGDGKLALVDGVFMEAVAAASRDTNATHVVVIEEINRGNPAQIFGELLTLLEADKRTPKAALELSYRRADTERVFIPNNLFIVGTMNIADRSLAMVDLALRRRFAFIDLEPAVGPKWREWVVQKSGIDPRVAAAIEQRICELNRGIEADSNLGRQFRIGHSFFTPPDGVQVEDTRAWFRRVVDTEIGPLLTEYWPDDAARVRTERQRLSEGI